MQHKLSGGGTFTPFYSPDSFGAVSGSFSKVILVDATLLTDFFDIVDNRHKNFLLSDSSIQILAFLSIYYE